VWDNEKEGGVFACPIIASVLTSNSIKGRVLGQSRNITAKNRLLICATGNHLSFSTEICRRTLLIEIDHQSNRVWGVQHLRKYVKQNQPELLRSALIVLKYGLSNPPGDTPPLDSLKTGPP
jgi:hypothetical protein